jgi:IS30 family transposase
MLAFSARCQKKRMNTDDFHVLTLVNCFNYFKCLVLISAVVAIGREDISRGIVSSSPLREIARRLDRAASTMSREVSRMVVVRPIALMKRMTMLEIRPCDRRVCLLAMNRKLRDIAVSKLILDWSPEQISGWLKTQYPDDESMRVSHETIYRSLFIQARGVLKKS